MGHTNKCMVKKLFGDLFGNFFPLSVKDDQHIVKLDNELNGRVLS